MEHELLEGVYPPQQFYDDTGLDNYKVYTGNVQERTAILNRLADAIDAELEQREPQEENECDFCGWFDGKHSPTCKVNWGQVPKCYEL